MNGERVEKQKFWRMAGWMFSGALVACFNNNALAQPSNIVPDDTLGEESSVVIPNFEGSPIELITGGAERGANLFHSFQEFNVSAGRGAYFFSPNADIANILSRVTGSNPSEILGTLGTIGASQPSLFLINPNGIIFGPEASLDVGGSFVATTTDGIQLGESGSFSAADPQSSNLLSVQPSALFVNTLSSPAAIVNRSRATSTVIDSVNGLSSINGLQVLDGQNLLLVSGNVRLEGGILYAPGGRVELGGLANSGTIELTAEGNKLLRFPDSVVRGNVVLTNEAEINVRADGGGSIAIEAANLGILEESQLRAGIAPGQGMPEAQAGDIEINAEEIAIDGESAVSNTIRLEAVGNGGNINITTGSLSVTDGALLNVSTLGQGNAGAIAINATRSVTFDGVGSNGFSSGAGSAVGEEAEGDAGGIEITTGSLSVTNGAVLTASTFSQGNAGRITINATDTVSFDGVGSNGFSSGAGSAVEEGAKGDAGGVEITTDSLFVTDGAALDASTLGQGNGGEIEITTGSLSVTNGAVLTASTFSQGNAGRITINATDTVSFDGVGSNGFSSSASSVVAEGAEGNGGEIEITTGSLSVTDRAQLITITAGQGNAGRITINATDTVSFDRNSAAFSSVEKGAKGQGDNINITTRALSVTDGAQIISTTAGQGDAGGIEITTGSLSATNGAVLTASTFSQGNAGRITINATDTVSFDGVGSNGFSSSASSVVAEGAEGNGGEIEITTGSLSVTDRAQLNASTLGQGNAGSITINATDTVSFDGVGSNGFSSGAGSAVEEGAKGDAGGIEITTGSLSVTDGAQLDASTFSQGDAGSIIIAATDTVSFDGVDSNGFPSSASSSVAEGAEGDAGGIEITTGSLSATNGAVLNASTFSQGNAGRITINATDTVSFDGVASNGSSSGAYSSVAEGAEGDAGGVEITTGSLSATNGALLNASTLGQGNAGRITINATDTVSFDGVGSNGFSSGAGSAVEEGAKGDAGGVEITTDSLFVTDGAALDASTAGQGDAGGIEITAGSLSVTDGAVLTASTFSQGNAGRITINATDTVSFDGVGSDGFSSGAYSSVAEGAEGDAGGIEITAGSLSVTDGALLSAFTAGRGNGGRITVTANTLDLTFGSQLLTTTDSNFSAGNINLFIKDSLTLSGENTGFFANTTPNSTGKGGSIFIDPQLVVIQDGAAVAVNSQGSGEGGDIELIADNLTLDNGTISAETASNTGGEIFLQASDLLQLRDNSQISATAGIAQGGGDGGNIDINADFILAFPQNNDITANAFEGQGGNINLTAQGIFGLQFRDEQTPLNDITASSELGVDGAVEINTPEVDPAQGLVALPTEVVDVSGLIAQSCLGGGATASRESEFVVTGRGGLPPNPTEALRGEALLSAEWVTIEPEGETESPTATSPPPDSPPPQQIVEPQGWVVGPNGNVLLTATAPTTSPQSSWSPPTSCRDF